MKKNMFMILVGVAALHIAVFSGLFATGGCTNVVMDERGYVPAPADTPVPMETAAPAPMTPMVTETAAPAAQPATAAPVETFQPMTGVTSSGGVGSVAAAGSGTYTVKAGDTLGKIANAHGVSLSAMLKANNMDLKSARRLRIGQKLVIPTSTRPVRKNSARRNGKTVRSSSAAAVAADGTYTVKAGDTLGGIARRLKVKTADLQKANNLSDAQVRRLQIGQKLVVPGKGAVTAAPASAAVETTPASREMDNLLKGAASAAVTETATPAPANEVPATVTETAAPAPAPVEVKTEVISGNSMPFEVDRDGVTLDEFAKQHSTTVEALKQLNADLPRDGMLKKGTVLFVPAE
ncbi:MAG: LysM peptidoglycan-binding domain-containing protein [Lentisphaeria bacterium]|nr:MAG: LysM peptidoglycan-binding domain-containing protein [Lentisphaeria bacterium]